MRIGEALDRLFSPGGADDRAADTRTSDAADAEAFAAAFEDAIDRRDERAGAGGFDAAAAIVIDPRFVLSLGAPAKSLEAGGEFDAQAATAAEGARARDTHERQTHEVDERRDARDESDGVARDSSAAAARDDAAAQDARDATQAHDASADAARSDDGTDGSAHADDTNSPHDVTGAESTKHAVEEIARQIASSAEAAASDLDGGSHVAPASQSASVKLDVVAQASRSETSSANGAQPVDVAQSIAGTTQSGFDARERGGDSGAAPRAFTPIDVGGASPLAGDAGSFASALANQIASIDGSATATATGAAPSEVANSGAPNAVDRVEQNSILTRLSDGVAGALRAGKREVVVRLSPPNLGSVRIRFQFDEHRLSARVEVSDPAVHRALESGVAELRSALRQHAVELTDLALAHGDGHGSEDRGDQTAEDNSRDNATRFAPVTEPNPVSERRRAPHRAGGLDITA